MVPQRSHFLLRADTYLSVAAFHSLSVRSKQMPAQAAAMERRMNEYLKAVNAQMATVNPNYDASKARK
jgi:hypothetical protein